MNAHPHHTRHRRRPLALAAALLATQAVVLAVVLAATPPEQAIEIQQAALPLDLALVQLAARTGQGLRGLASRQARAMWASDRTMRPTARQRRPIPWWTLACATTRERGGWR